MKNQEYIEYTYKTQKNSKLSSRKIHKKKKKEKIKQIKEHDIDKIYMYLFYEKRSIKNTQRNIKTPPKRKGKSRSRL